MKLLKYGHITPVSEHALRGVTIAMTADQKLEEVKSCMVGSGLWFSFDLVCACPQICSILKTIYILYCSFWKKTRTVLAVYFGGLFYSSVISFLLVHIRIWLRRLNMWTLTCPQYQIYQQTKKKHVLNIANLLLCGKIFFCFFIV